MPNFIDLTGQKFGRLTAIKKMEHNKWGKTMWLCKCECGKEKIFRGHSLREGLTKSCGCLQKEIARVTGINNGKRFGLANMRIAISLYKIRAKKRGLEYKLTEEQFEEITKQDCYYCGVKPNNKYDRNGLNGEFIYNGIDRIDNEKGYTMDNVVPCCKHCNMAKNTFTTQEFKNWIKKIYDNFYIEGVV